MRLHVTMLNGIGTASAASIAMRNVATIAKEFGATEMNFYKYDVNYDSDKELSARLDGILAPMWHGDVIILQLPTWNDIKYENTFVNKIRGYSNSKIVMFVHDIIPLMMNLGEDYLLKCVELYNKADVLILPSREMHELLKTKGLTVEKVLYQEIWDYPMQLEHVGPTFERTLHFPGHSDRYPFIKEWKGESIIELYGSPKFTDSPKFKFNPLIKSNLMIYKILRRGFGLLWAGEEQMEYCKLNQPFKLGTFLAAGLPIIVQRGMHVSQFVVENEIGFAVDTLEEADCIVQEMTEQEYLKLSERVEKYQFLVTSGCYTRKLINDAIILALK